jgi:hypothetical protein
MQDATKRLLSPRKTETTESVHPTPRVPSIHLPRSKTMHAKSRSLIRGQLPNNSPLKLQVVKGESLPPKPDNIAFCESFMQSRLQSRSKSVSRQSTKLPYETFYGN